MMRQAFMKYLRDLYAWVNFERFSIHVKSALNTAEGEAARPGSACVDTEHLLLGMLAEADGTAVKILQRLSCDVTNIRNQLQRSAEVGPPRPRGQMLARTAAVKRAIKYAVEQARATHAPSTGTEHFLLAFLQQPKCLACQVLTDAGVTLDLVRAAVDAENGRLVNVRKQ
jgi:ATP-dependent Clp protease ATP-binding subunit ClpA